MTSKSAKKSPTPNTLNIPKLKKLRTEWDLKKYYYASENDPRIERDIKRAEKLYASFEKKYKNKSFTSNAKKLKAVLTEYEKLIADPAGNRAIYYFHYRHTLNAHDSNAEKRLNLISERLTKAGNRIIFFELALGKIPRQDQKRFLNDPSLTHFHYYLKRVFLEAKHTLSEKEERILSLTSGPSSGMWVDGTEKILSKRTLVFEGREIGIPEALEMIDLQKPAKKQKLWDLILDKLEDISEIAENEFNAIITNKKIRDELRGYPKPYSATVLAYENDERSVETLIDVVSNRGFELSQRFYKLKAKFHGVKHLPYVNKYDPIGKTLSIPYREAVELVREAFYRTKREYGEFFDQMVTEGNVDVFPRKGKRGGAFMSSDINQPTFVFLNSTENFKSLETLAHEMGHALHSERSKKQKPLYEGYSITAAETASTLFENIVFNHILPQMKKADQRLMLHDRITRDISTIQRQIAFYNYELELHETIRRQGAMTKEELQQMMQRHLKSYLGPAVQVTERDGLSYIYVPHFRYGFYVYSYAYGILMSSIMARNLNEDDSYIKKIDAFLTAGGSDTVENIFRSIGIDPMKRSTFEKSLSSLEEDISAFEKLT